MQASKEVTVALLGCGRFGQRHLEVLNRLPDVRVLVVADIDEPRARQTAFRFGVPSFTADFREALAWPGVDVVDVCLPTFLHAQAVEGAARHGRHVFCEKPLALRAEDAERAARACEDAGVKLQVGFCRRFDNGWLAAAEVIRSGALGRPVVWRHATGTSGAPQPWFFDRELGGGPFVDGAIHWYDFGRFLFGEVESVQAATRIMRPGRTAPDTGIVSVRFVSGDELQLMWSWGLPPGVKVDELHEVLGPEGALSMRPRQQEKISDAAVFVDHDHRKENGGHANGADPGNLGYLWLSAAGAGRGAARGVPA
ncbi:MAG: Gfo/Idh/MocA family oxidoreductase [Limnochordaceae bacterium]|nr:Gfo/Idh/MocA family oxidoreductase [Limnochordaceae bacterium]